MQKKLDSIESLPTLPIIVQQIQQLITSRTANMSQIASVIARDQAISARVIKLINSAFYGIRSKITSIQQAIVMLGLNTVKNLVTGVAIVRSFEHDNHASLFDREKFWLHTFGCAMGARTIAVRLKRDEPEDYFLAGLLHDVGILILDQFCHREFVEVLQTCVSQGTSYIDAERSVIGFTHCEAGEFLARRWKMPEMLINPIRFHHEPSFSGCEENQDLDIVAAVHVCNTIANKVGIHMGVRCGIQDCSSSALKHLGVTVEDVQTEFESVRNEIGNLMREWGI